MTKKTTAIILAAMIIAVSGCNNAQPAATTTTNTVQVAGTDASEDLYFYTEDIKYYLPTLIDAHFALCDVIFEDNASTLRNSSGKCREITEKFLALDCPCEPISEVHNTMIADGEKYLGLLDKIDRYAYYLDEAQTRTDFTDEEMIEMQELIEFKADPYKDYTAFENSIYATLDAAQLYLQ